MMALNDFRVKDDSKVDKLVRLKGQQDWQIICLKIWI